MNFKNTRVYGFEGAIRGMRNPLESWHKSDSFFGFMSDEQPLDDREEVVDAWIIQELNKKNHKTELYSPEWEEIWEKYSNWLWDNECLEGDHNMAVVAALGPNDLCLAQRLILAGPEHCKFMRQIFVSVDLTMPLYIWKEFDTYKVGTTANSTSTMHKLTSKPITKDLFEFDNGEELNIVEYNITHGGEHATTYSDYQKDIIDMCENIRQKYIETKDKCYWRALVQILPEAWLQTRTVTMSYANLRNIYFQRKNHKLKEWHLFCDWVSQLPYAKELIMLEENNETN